MMTIKMTATGETVTVNDSYANRLIAFGYAVCVKDDLPKMQDVPAKEEKTKKKSAKE